MVYTEEFVLDQDRNDSNGLLNMIPRSSKYVPMITVCVPAIGESFTRFAIQPLVARLIVTKFIIFIVRTNDIIVVLTSLRVATFLQRPSERAKDIEALP
jgi:hypothetical protein